jgi:hypothetical protein
MVDAAAARLAIKGGGIPPASQAILLAKCMHLGVAAQARWRNRFRNFLVPDLTIGIATYPEFRITGSGDFQG